MNLSAITMTLTHSMHKQFPEEPVNAPALSEISALRGETVSVQAIVLLPSGEPRGRASVQVHTALPCRVYQVCTVPVRLAVYDDQSDDGYLRKTPGLYPDLLQPYHGEKIWLNPGQAVSLWVELTVPADQPAGEYPLTAELKSDDGIERDTRTAALKVTIEPAALPEQQLICTQWFHSDCLADYYHVPVFSKEYWTITERFMRSAVQCGTNMLLTPVLTPALDTAVGGERTTVQLADVTQSVDGQYTFDFAQLRRWVETAQRVGIRYFELSHLFTQWGAKACPKVMAHTPDGDRRIFGWDTASDSEAYMRFLAQLLPALLAELRALGVAENIRFHLSDEPSAEALPLYLKLRQRLAPLLEGIPVMDALSHYDFYAQGAVDQPVVGLNHVQPFLDHQVRPLWVYYCCGQCAGVSNRFISMPSARNRVLGFQLYLADAAGFLQWGFNFYNGVYSERQIDPYLTTDSDGAFPAGDPFLVYPGADGAPVPSIRYEVFGEALQDQRACALLAQYTGRAHVCELIRSAGIDGFFDVPYDAEKLLALRACINAEIGAAARG